ncbi:heme-binding protein [Azospirillum sp. SYSU D00513]|uniref:heme-binding protein n=1 Tax=Azospirillum sp. SYSU D00513 TaxID=2812561 RepID=UPI001A978093|nr:heme-binding protein [Azospirillum sp. SYSU D00513]
MIDDSQTALLERAPTTDTPPATQLRAVPSQLATADRLGALKDLPGFWEGTGFSLIARPDFSGKSPNGIFLQLNLLRETIEFTSIGSPVFNRGSLQDDIAIYGVTYLHRVTDAVSGGALHIEPGMWLNIPETTSPKADASIARLATIPHGNAVCTVGFVQQAVFDKLPTIPPANTVPFGIGGQPPAAGTKNPFPEYDLGTASSFRTSPLPDGITQAILDDPNQVLRDALAQQVNVKGMTLKAITRLITQTPASGGIANIPFINSNADAPSMESVFAIETVEDACGNEFLQLQYSQTVLLNFGGRSWPHVTVGTLIKAF